MFIEQIIEFELTESGSPGRAAHTPTFDKTKISEEITSCGLFYYLLVKYCMRQCTLLPPIWAKSRTKFNPKIARL